MRKVVIVQEKIPHYRIPFFREFGKLQDVECTVIHSDSDFKIKTLEPTYVFLEQKQIFSFKWLVGLDDYIDSADICILMFDLHWVYLYKHLLKKNRKKIYLWGIGISSSGGLKQKKLIDKLRLELAKLSKGLILYTHSTAEYYSSISEKIFIANNTVEVKKFPLVQKNKDEGLVFIGTVNKRKGIEEILMALSVLKKQYNCKVPLKIIGDGPYLEELKSKVVQNDLEGQVLFIGRNTNDEELYKHVKRSIVSLSPSQAGLSVLHSMAMGLPFVTKKNAITGGEISNIENGYNGYFVKDHLEMAEVIMTLIQDDVLVNKLARNAYEYYHSSRQIKNMVQNFKSALEL